MIFILDLIPSETVTIQDRSLLHRKPWIQRSISRKLLFHCTFTQSYAPFVSRKLPGFLWSVDRYHAIRATRPRRWHTVFAFGRNRTLMALTCSQCRHRAGNSPLSAVRLVSHPASPAPGNWTTGTPISLLDLTETDYLNQIGDNKTETTRMERLERSWNLLHAMRLDTVTNL